MGAIRMNFTLPEDVVKLIKKNTKRGEQSSYIAEAVREFGKLSQKKQLIEQMIKGYLATAREDSELAAEFESTLNDGLSGVR